MITKEVGFLLVEDDEVSVIAVKRAFKKAKLVNPLHVAKDGIQALEMLRGENGHAVMPKPLLILLDLNMPRMNGFEFLAALRDDHELRRTVVFVLTTSNAEKDKAQAYDKCIAGYIVKGNLSEDLMNTINLLDRYWRVVELPE